MSGYLLSGQMCAFPPVLLRKGTGVGVEPGSRLPSSAPGVLSPSSAGSGYLRAKTGPSVTLPNHLI